ncbi:MAG TPA: hypothetical protein VJS44_08415 [Pyrinomonadaceae bacterium]|nr:hypothetical protein [Pyrinomonadaceae bacterium]
MSFLELLLDPARREEAAREQGERREKNQHVAARSPAQATYLFSVGREQAVLEQLREGADEERRAVLYEQLAEAYAGQGKFEQAAAVSLSEDKGYAERAEAVKALGRKRCPCPEAIRVPSKRDAKGERVETQRRVEEVFDGQTLIGIFTCISCRKMSAKPVSQSAWRENQRDETGS